MLLGTVCCTGQYQSINWSEKRAITDSVVLYQISTDQYFKDKQSISLVDWPKSVLKKYRIKYAFDTSRLIKTSDFALSNQAVLGINGGFFDMKNGGSVSYFEYNDSTYHFTRGLSDKWQKPESGLNAALVLRHDGEIDILPAESDGFYESSSEELGVMIAGPLLLRDSLKMPLRESSFVLSKHPRTCICETRSSYLFLVIDGRSTLAAGMSLPEVQDFMLELGCLDAINLDGGGSTTLWIKPGGIVNQPSYIFGERPVANAILIISTSGRG